MPIWLFIPLPRTEYHLLRDLILCACLWTSLLQRPCLSDSPPLRKEKPALPTATPLQSLIIMTRRERISPYPYILSAFIAGTSCRRTTDRWEELKTAYGQNAEREMTTVTGRKSWADIWKVLWRYKQNTQKVFKIKWKNTLFVPTMTHSHFLM